MKKQPRFYRIMHLYWNNKRKRVRKKNLTRFAKWMIRDGKGRSAWEK